MAHAAADGTFGSLPLPSVIPSFPCPGLRKHPGVGRNDLLSTSAQNILCPLVNKAFRLSPPGSGPLAGRMACWPRVVDRQNLLKYPDNSLISIRGRLREGRGSYGPQTPHRTGLELLWWVPAAGDLRTSLASRTRGPRRARPALSRPNNSRFSTENQGPPRRLRRARPGLGGPCPVKSGRSRPGASHRCASQARGSRGWPSWLISKYSPGRENPPLSPTVAMTSPADTTSPTRFSRVWLWP